MDRPSLVTLSNLTYTYKLSEMYYLVTKNNTKLSLMMIIGISIIFPALKLTLKTGYSDQYAWIWTVVLSFGSTSAILLLLVWMVVSIIVVMDTYEAHNKVAYNEAAYHTEKNHKHGFIGVLICNNLLLIDK